MRKELIMEERKMNEEGHQLRKDMIDLARMQYKENIFDQNQVGSNAFDSAYFMDQQEEESSLQVPEPNLMMASRYKLDFEELEKIGEGGAGRVFRARHKIDKNIYAIKKVRLSRRDHKENERIKREVAVLSRLHN